MSAIGTILPFYVGHYALTPKGRKEITGVLIDLVLHKRMHDVKPELKRLEHITEDVLLKIADIEYPEKANYPNRKQVAAVFMASFGKMGGLPETIALLCREGYDVFGAIDKGLAIEKKQR